MDVLFFFNLQNFKESIRERRELNISFSFSRQASVTMLRRPPCSGVGQHLKSASKNEWTRTAPNQEGLLYLEPPGILQTSRDFCLFWSDALRNFCLFVCFCKSILLDFFFNYTNNGKNTGGVWLKIENCPSLSDTRAFLTPLSSHAAPSMLIPSSSVFLLFICGHEYTHTHTHVCRYVPSCRGEPYRILQPTTVFNQQCLLLATLQPSPLSCSKDNLACWNHVLSLPSGQRHEALKHARRFTSPPLPAGSQCLKLPEAAFSAPPALFSSPSATDTLHFSCELLTLALRAEQLPKQRENSHDFSFFFFFF